MRIALRIVILLVILVVLLFAGQALETRGLASAHASRVADLRQALEIGAAESTGQGARAAAELERHWAQ